MFSLAGKMAYSELHFWDLLCLVTKLSSRHRKEWTESLESTMGFRSLPDSGDDRRELSFCLQHFSFLHSD